MGLLLGLDYDVFPDGLHREEMERFAAAIQNWAGKQDANAKWITVPYNASDFFARGTGNTWVVPNYAYNRISYYVMNDVMLLNVFVSGSTLTVSPSPNNNVSIRMPDGYRIAGTIVNGVQVEGRIYSGAVVGMVASTVETLYSQALVYYPTEVQVLRYSGNYTDGIFAAQFQLALEVVRV